MNVRMFLLEVLVKPLQNVLSPPSCVVCDTLFSDDVLSKTHTSSLSRLPEFVCDSCFVALPLALPSDELLAKLSRDFHEDDIAITSIYALFAYERGTVAEMIHRIKYEGGTQLGTACGMLAGEEYQRQNSTMVATIDAVLPVPLHSARRRERGYNQAECIAKGVAKAVGKPLDTRVLTRRKHVASQVSFSGDERRARMHQDIFHASAARARGKIFLLVDDVLTTGATLNACAMALLNAGARAVHVLALAAGK